MIIVEGSPRAARMRRKSGRQGRWARIDELEWGGLVGVFCCNASKFFAPTPVGEDSTNDWACELGGGELIGGSAILREAPSNPPQRSPFRVM
jgi:hypothetical protein